MSNRNIKRIDINSFLDKSDFLKDHPKLKLTIKIFLSLESIVLLLFVLNLFFSGYTNIFIFHSEVWKTLLATNTFKVMLVYAIPIGLTAMGAAFNENAGVINIGLEGIMLWGAWAAVYFTFITGNPWIGVFGAILFGFINALLHAVLTITYKSEQIVTGVAINLFAGGMTDVLTKLIWNTAISKPVTGLPNVNFYSIPVLGTILQFIRFKNYFEVPVLGTILRFIPDPIDALSNHSGLFYISLFLIPLAHTILFRTKWGLRMRVIGEHPQAAATAGIPVRKYQYYAVLISGMLAGLGGALLSIGAVSLFSASIVGGRGFTALAAMIFGKWTIIGSIASAIFFGYFYAISIRLGNGSVNNFRVPNQLVQMMPFIISIMALSGFIGKATPPTAIGKPYDPTDE